jgi:hypothetical protein
MRLINTRWVFGAFLVVLSACNTQTPPPTPGFTLEQIGQLTPEQIENLSEAQLQDIQGVLEPEFNRLESQLTADLAGLEDDGSLSALANWPNYSLTLHYAAGVSVGYFMNNVRGRYSGPNWSNDGCSNSPDKPLLLNFKDSCIQHDFGYRNVPQYSRGRNETVRNMIDNRFLSNLRGVCSSLHWYDPRKSKCDTLAYAYYAAVRNFGKGSYYGTPQRYP